MLFFKELEYKDRHDFQHVLNQHKICVIRGCSELDLLGAYKDLANSVGILAPMDENLDTGNKNGEFFTEIRYDPTKPDSFRHSCTRQPLHTDGSYEKNAPDISFFFCVTKAKYGGATTFVDSAILCDVLAYHDPEFYIECMSLPLTFGKGDDSKTRPIIMVNDDIKLTWNYYRVMPSNHLESILRENFHKFLESCIVETGLCFPVVLNKGDAVFFHDELLLHGRNAFVGDRFLLKGGLWMK